MTLQVGDLAPHFSLPSDSDSNVSLTDFKGQNVILYFYPKDDTPGCTLEACGFTESQEAIKSLNAVILGVSKDSVASHKKFKEKHQITFPLLSDVDGTLCEAYGTWTEKSMYGKKYMGIDRSTFLIDGTGTLRAIWRGVKVPGHISAVIEALKDL
ncbi:MAG: thioredoxin-dependent thiol peroxidase [Candidatus Nucleicultricaceae bacterium]